MPKHNLGPSAQSTVRKTRTHLSGWTTPMHVMPSRVSPLSPAIRKWRSDLTASGDSHGWVLGQGPEPRRVSAYTNWGRV